MAYVESDDNTPQITTRGVVKDNKMIVFSWNIYFFEAVFIVSMPRDDEQKTVPIYIKFKLNSSLKI